MMRTIGIERPLRTTPVILVVLTLGLAITIGVLIPSGVQRTGVTPTQLAVLVLVLLLQIVSFSPLIVGLLRQGRVDLFSPVVFWPLYGLTGSLRPLQIAFLEGWSTNWGLYGEGFVGRLLIEALFLHILGKVAFLWGFYHWSGRSLSKRLPALSQHLNSSRLLLIIGALGIIGLVAYVQTIGLAGGFWAYINSLGARRGLLTGRAYLVWGSQFFALAAQLVLVHSIRTKHRPLMAASLVWNVVAFVLVATLGGRGDAVRLVLIAAVIIHYSVRRIPLWALGAVGLLLFQFVYLFGIARDSSIHGQFEITQDMPNNPLVVVTEFVSEWGSIDRFLVFLNGVPERIGFQYFATYLRFFAAFVPRALWPGKPGLTEANVYAPLFGQYGQNYATFPAGTTGEYYLQLGIFSVVLLWFLTGVVMRTGYEYLHRTPHDPTAALIYAFFLLNLSGLTNLALMGFVLRAAPLVVILWFVSGRRDRSALYEPRAQREASLSALCPKGTGQHP